MDEAGARRVAEAELARWNARLTPDRTARPPETEIDPEREFVVWRIEGHERAWIVHFATRRWLRTRATSDLVVGSCPLVVDRATGELHHYGSGPDGYADFLSWCDHP
jgi:hypothetical protein